MQLLTPLCGPAAWGTEKETGAKKFPRRSFAEDRAGERSRTFEQLMLDLSHYVQHAIVYARGDEFYFDGRRAGGCGFNGGIIPHIHDNSYGIHT